MRFLGVRPVNYREFVGLGTGKAPVWEDVKGQIYFGDETCYVPRSHPDGFSVNARCLDSGTVEGMSIRAFNGREWEKQYPKRRGEYRQ